MTFRCKRCEHSMRLIEAPGDLCNHCWEVEIRLSRYLRSPGGREFAKCALAKSTNRCTPPEGAA